MMVWYDIVLRLFIAIIVGACIGMERQWRHRMAGLRTNALVSLGACIFVLLSVMIDHTMLALHVLPLKSSVGLVF